MKITNYILCTFCTFKALTQENEGEDTRTTEIIAEREKVKEEFRQRIARRQNEQINEFITSKYILREIESPNTKQKKIMINKCENYKAPTYDEKVTARRQQRAERKEEQINELLTLQKTIAKTQNPTLEQKEMIIDNCENHKSSTFDKKTKRKNAQTDNFRALFEQIQMIVKKNKANNSTNNTGSNNCEIWCCLIMLTQQSAQNIKRPTSKTNKETRGTTQKPINQRPLEENGQNSSNKIDQNITKPHIKKEKNVRDNTRTRQQIHSLEARLLGQHITPYYNPIP